MTTPNHGRAECPAPHSIAITSLSASRLLQCSACRSPDHYGYNYHVALVNMPINIPNMNAY